MLRNAGFDGCYLVRASETRAGAMVLSVGFQGRVHHYRVLFSPDTQTYTSPETPHTLPSSLSLSAGCFPVCWSPAAHSVARSTWCVTASSSTNSLSRHSSTPCCRTPTNSLAHVCDLMHPHASHTRTYMHAHSQKIFNGGTR